MGKKAVVRTRVHIGTPRDMEGYGLTVNIEVEGVDNEIVKAGRKVCLDSHDELSLLLKRLSSPAHTVVLSPVEPKLTSLWLDPVCSKCSSQIQECSVINSS